MTSAPIHSESVKAEGEGPYLLMKRGLFYRPAAHGYTGLRREAGHYNREEAEGHCHHCDSVTMVLASEAPEFSPACWPETKAAELQRRLAEKRDREDEDYRHAVDRVRPRDVLASVRWIIKGRIRQEANWILAMKVYGLGSTYAWRLCVDEGIDPDGFTSEPFHPDANQKGS